MKCYARFCCWRLVCLFCLCLHSSGLAYTFTFINNDTVTRSWTLHIQQSVGGFVDLGSGNIVAGATVVSQQGAEDRSIVAITIASQSAPGNITTTITGAKTATSTFGPQSPVRYLQYKLVNNSDVPLVYDQDGAALGGPGGVLNPGQSVTVLTTGTSGPFQMVIGRTDAGGNRVVVTTILATDAAWDQNNPPATTKLITDNGFNIRTDDFTGTDTDHPPVYSIRFSQTNAASSDLTIQQGFNALKTIEAQGFQDDLAALGKIAANQVAGNSSLNSIDGKLTTANNSLSSINLGISTLHNDLANLQNTDSSGNGYLSEIDAKLAQIRDEQRTNHPSQIPPANPDVNSQSGSGSAAGASDKSAWDTHAGALTPGTGGGYSPGSWEITLHYGGTTKTIDLNPLNNAAIADFASALRSLLIWLISILYFVGVFNVTNEHAKLGPAIRQAQSAGTSVLGNNANSVVALICAAAITVALAALPAIYLTFAASHNVVSTFVVNPFATMAGAGGSVGMAVGLANGFLPLDLIYGYIVSYFAFKVSVAGLFQFTSTIVRFIVG